MWCRLWKITGIHVEFSRFLPPDENTEDFSISCKTTWVRAFKNRAFSVFKVNFSAKNHQNFSKKKVSPKNLKWEEQLLVKWLWILIISIKVYLVKMGLIFDSSDTSCLTRNKKILSVCSFGCKNVLNTTWFPMIFHNCHCTTE